MRRRAIALALAGGAFFLCGQDRGKETALGAQLASQFRSKTVPLGLPEIDQYVRNLTGKLAGQMSTGAVDWTPSVIRDRRGGSTCEPISLPGGYLFVPARLILGAGNEAELAGMLAHSMAHVIAMHGTRVAATADLTTLPMIFVSGLGLGGDDEQSLIPVGFLETQRQYELEADRFAVLVMRAAGCNPSALSSYDGRMQLREDSRPAKASSPLPSRQARLSNLRQAMKDLPPLNTQPRVDDFHSIQDEVRSEFESAAAAPRLNHIPSLTNPAR